MMNSPKLLINLLYLVLAQSSEVPGWSHGEIKKHRGAEWLEQNREAIEAYNRHIEKHGLFSGRFRTFAIERE